MTDDRRRSRQGTMVAATLLAAAALLSLVSPPQSVTPAFAVVAPLVAAAFLSVQRTALFALVSVVEVFLLASAIDGYEGWGLASRATFGVFGGVLAVGLAVARVRREQQLAVAREALLSETLFRTVADTSADPIFAKDLDGRYILANDAAAESLGHASSADVLGRRDIDLVEAEVAASIEADDRRVLELGALVELEDVREVDGGERIYLTHKNVLRDADGQVTGIAGVSKDITNRRQAQRELERSENRFRSLVEATSAIVWRADARGSFTEPQLQWESITGQSWDRQRDLGWVDAVHPDDREDVTELWQRSLDDQTLFAATCRVWNAGRGIFQHFAVRAVPALDAQGDLVEWLGSYSDIHDRVMAEQQLQRVTRVRELVAEVASEVAVADGVVDVIGAALTVLSRQLPATVVGATLVQTQAAPVAVTYSVRAGGFPFLHAELPIGPDHLVAVADPPIGRQPALFPTVAAAALKHPVLSAAVEQGGGGDPEAPETAGPLIAIDLVAASAVGVLWIRCEDAIEPATVAIARFAVADLAPVIAHSLTQAAFQEREAEIASSFQQSMLELSWKPDPRLDVAVHYQAGSEQLEAGGDWYDLVALADGRIGLMIGDVVGRSLTAATVMGRLRMAGRALLLADGDPARVLDHLDNLALTIDSAPYTTCCCVVIDPASERIEYSTAGHPPPLIIGAGGATHLLWDAQGPPLALPRANENRRSASASFTVGDRIVLYTDGLVERRTESIDAGLERLAVAASAAERVDVVQMCRHLVASLFDDFTQNDDVAVVCAQLVTPDALRFERQVPNQLAHLRVVRRELRPWLVGHGATDGLIHDVLLAVTEALSNAMDHAGDPGGITRLSVRRSAAAIEVHVADNGSWLERDPDPSRGRGLAIMRSIAERVEVDRGGDGTIVTLEFRPPGG